jgi:penicillin-binding protein 1B
MIKALAARKLSIVGIVGLGMAGVVLLSAMALVAYSTVELSRFGHAETRRAVFIHSAGQALEPGVSVRAIDLAGILARLGYTETKGAPAAPGQYRRAGGIWDIYLREEAARVGLEVRGERIARVTRDGKEVQDAALEGEVLTGGADQPGEDYRPIKLAETSKVLIDAVIAIEDHRFFDHGALDLRSLARAVWANARAGKVTEGGSTITQQLIKNRLLTPDRTMARKLREAWLATLVEWRYSKSQILEAYLNEIYLGQRGSLAIRGVGAASRAYFGKEAHQLSPGEAALLAGMVRAPNTYSPVLNPERAQQRRDVVLGRMRELKTLDAAAYERARNEPVRALVRPRPGQPAPYFTDHARQEVEERFGWGTRIVTTLDLTLQRFAENAVAGGLDQLESRYPKLRRSDPRERLQAALIALDPATGEIRAYVGGRDYQASQFDRVTLARRQPGSAFKPFVYLAALSPRAGGLPFTAATMVEDAPITLSVNGKPWSPRNYEDRYEGRVSVRRALEQSLNGATVRMAQVVGAPAIAETAKAFGLVQKAAPIPSLALGALEVTPIDLAAAYIPFAGGGLRPGAIRSVRAVYQADGSPAAVADDAAPSAVITPAEAYLMTSMLQGVISKGTARAAQSLAASGDIAGKTGTTNEGRDAWFVGYSSRLVAAVWVGFDDNAPHGLSGSAAALPIWTQFMKQALDAYPAAAFTVPAGITTASIDTSNGRLAGESCPHTAREIFLTGTEPEACTEHSGITYRVESWWNRVRDWFKR